MTPRARLDDPRPLATDRVVARLQAKIASLGIDLTVPLPDTPEPVPALEAAQARIPAEYRAATCDHPRVAAWVHEIAEAAVAPDRGGRGRRQITTGPSLLLLGPTGTGKTHQAYGAIRALTAAGLGVRWQATTAADLYAEMRPRPGADPETLLRRTMRVPLLVLDDLGAARTTEWTEELTYRLVNWRYSHRLPTLVTSNLAPVRTRETHRDQPVLRERIGDRVASRLAGMCHQVALTGPDRRRVRAA
ncbi:ATP-binding protein [Streptomyces sp. URMC 125]|uniref:ATP-binding protein n=1 Tax=Streptomyces sp. URMC 125 TaxID=3423419 RepID=UPI003F1A5AB2